jgi:CubicO group peptidase (beta-lactamase class C family)
MRHWVKRILFAAGIVMLILLIIAGWYLSDTLPIGTGHTAKTVCSNVFISGRDADDAFKEDIAPLHFLFAITDFKADPDERSVSADAFGFAERKAIYRDGCGCTVVNGLTEDELRQHMFATPRDWARFGLLYLQDGVWDGERILPVGWVKYTTTPTPRAIRGEYGALFWLNAGSPSNASDRMMASVPADTFFARGFQEQRVFIVPSKELVLVRFGATSDKSAWNDDVFVAGMLAALPE